MKTRLPLLLALFASAALAEETRQLDSHEHGVGELDIAVDGKTVAIEFHVPGADIVGFEHVAESVGDRAAIDAAVATLMRPLELFVMPAAAECSVVQASAELASEGNLEEPVDHDDQDEGHDRSDGNEDDHAEMHDDHGGGHAGEEGHAEFHAEYTLTCGNPAALAEITFAYFDAFENARELEVRIVSASGAQAFEVQRDNPVLDLRGKF